MMSTSPSWFDQDKFSRLVKKVGPKTPAAQPAAGKPTSAKTLIKPLVKEAQLPSENIVEEKKPEVPKASILPPQAQLPPEEKAPEPEPKTSILPPQAQLPREEEEIAGPAPQSSAVPDEEEIPMPAPKAPPVEPPREARLSSRLPKIDLRKPAGPPPIPPPLHADAGAPVEEKPKEIEESPVLPGAANRPRTATLRMMTSQPLSLGKKTPPLPDKVEPKVEPIRAPEASGLSAVKAPPLTGTSISGKLPQRTTPLPALKSLFQYEIPGGQGTIPAKPPMEAPPAKSPLPTFSFQKPEVKAPTETLPPVLDDEEDIPTFAGQADAAHLAEIEEELTPENLAAEWGKADELKTELEHITKERDDALAEKDKLLQQLHEARESKPDQKPADTDELDFITKERDQVRGDYIKLREDFEKLKQELQGKTASEKTEAKTETDLELKKEFEQLRRKLSEKNDEIDALKLQTKETPAPEANPELEKELETLREQLAEKDRELDAAKTTSTGTNDVVDTLKAELETLKNDLKKAKDDASVAQRGLALSQKALQETRNALREASEGANKK